MPLYIQAICEEAGCNLKYTYSFECVVEPYGDLLAAMKAHGWRFDLNEKEQPVRMVCPKHQDTDAKESA